MNDNNILQVSCSLFVGRRRCISIWEDDDVHLGGANVSGVVIGEGLHRNPDNEVRAEDKQEVCQICKTLKWKSDTEMF